MFENFDMLSLFKQQPPQSRLSVWVSFFFNWIFCGSLVGLIFIAAAFYAGRISVRIQEVLASKPTVEDEATAGQLNAAPQAGVGTKTGDKYENSASLDKDAQIKPKQKRKIKHPKQRSSTVSIWGRPPPKQRIVRMQSECAITAQATEEKLANAKRPPATLSRTDRLVKYKTMNDVQPPSSPSTPSVSNTQLKHYDGTPLYIRIDKSDCSDKKALHERPLFEKAKEYMLSTPLANMNAKCDKKGPSAKQGNKASLNSRFLYTKFKTEGVPTIGRSPSPVPVRPKSAQSLGNLAALSLMKQTDESVTPGTQWLERFARPPAASSSRIPLPVWKEISGSSTRSLLKYLPESGSRDSMIDIHSDDAEESIMSKDCGCSVDCQGSKIPTPVDASPKRRHYPLYGLKKTRSTFNESQ